MKRLIAGVLVLLSLCWAADARFPRGTPSATPNANLRQENYFGLTGSAWNSFTGNYTPGLGNPAVSTDDWYHQNGLAGFRPYDLLDPSATGVCASAGASIAATPGKGRYAWPVTPDHGAGVGAVWNGSFDFRLGYSNDPGIPPSRANFIYSIDTNPVNPTISTITASISNGSGGAGNFLDITAYTGLITNDAHASVSGAGVTTAVINSQSTGTQGQTGRYVISGAAQFVASQTMTVTQSGYFLYYGGQLVCNPDDATTPFWLYSEGQGAGVQHQQGVIKSADLDTWTTPQPTHNALNFGTWSSFQRVNRIGTGNWVSKGFQVSYPQNGSVFARSTWTSPDGDVWTPGTTNLNNCIPASSQVGTTTACTGDVRTFGVAEGSPFTVTIGGTPWILGKIDTLVGGSRIGSQWAGRAAVDSSQNVIDSPAAINISSAYDGVFPGSGYLQTVTGYVEDGIAHYYAMKGWPISSGLWFQAPYAPYANNGGCAVNPTVNGQQGFFQFTGFTSGTTLTVQTLGTGTPQLGSLIYGNGISNTTNTRIVSQVSGAPNGVGDYTISSSITVGSGTISGSSCGGLWQQNMDYLTEIVDATAAAGAAPVGVRASCAASTATVSWYAGVLPTDTMRLYRGTTAGSQTTLVGDFTGATATDTGMTLDAVTYYKLVYLNGGVEQKDRVVSTYCSSSIYPEVNAHMTRALAEGADPTTCDRTFMDTFYGWLTTNGRKSNLLLATMPEFCVARTGSVVTKVFDMGTTRLPRGGDYTTMTSGVTYNATGVGGKPAWVNATSADKGYYGGNRSYLNNIRRKTQITFFAAYQKPSTNQIRPFVYGQFASAAYLEHASGSPGTINCAMYDATQQKIAAATPASATAFNTATCTFDGTNWTAYANAAAGTPQTGLVIPSPNINPPDGLTGQVGSASLTNVLVSGDAAGLYGRSGGSFSSQGNLAQYSGRAQMVFDVALTGAEITSLDALVR